MNELNGAPTPINMLASIFSLTQANKFKFQNEQHKQTSGTPSSMYTCTHAHTHQSSCGSDTHLC